MQPILKDSCIYAFHDIIHPYFLKIKSSFWHGSSGMNLNQKLVKHSLRESTNICLNYILGSNIDRGKVVGPPHHLIWLIKIFNIWAVSDCDETVAASWCQHELSSTFYTLTLLNCFAQKLSPWELMKVILPHKSQHHL